MKRVEEEIKEKVSPTSAHTMRAVQMPDVARRETWKVRCLPAQQWVVVSREHPGEPFLACLAKEALTPQPSAQPSPPRYK